MRAEYELTGLVKHYGDYDGFNYCFYDAAQPPASQARIDLVLDTIEFTDTCEGTDTLGPGATGIWAFGYYGYVFFSDGRIKAETDQPMSQGDRMIVMCRFAHGLFIPEVNREEQAFETDVKELAFVGSDYPLDDEGDGGSASLMGGDDTPMWVQVLFNILGGLCCFGLPLFLLIYRLFGKSIHRWNLRRKMRKLLDGMPDYYYEVPLGGQLLRSRRILSALDGSVKEDQMKLIEACVLRLVDRKRLEVVREMDSKGELQELFRINDTGDLTPSEEGLLPELWALLKLAAGDDRMLQPQELKTLIKENPVEVRTFARKLQALNNVEVSPKDVRRDEAQQVYGFWKYLNDFTLVGERALQEVALWKEYLIFATLFGIADKVRADMKRIAPDLKSIDGLARQVVEGQAGAMLCYALSDSIMDAARRTINYETDAERRARIRAERARRNSGGGGRSSFGGGGGFSGGGGSGVR